MRFTIAVVLAAGASFLAGCAPAVSVHPLYTSQDLAADPSLEGQWTDQDGETWQIQKSGNGYDVTVFHQKETPSTESFNIHLLRLEDAEFADVTAKSNSSLAITGHLFAKIWREGDDMCVALLDDDWLKSEVELGNAPPSIIGDDHRQIILTAPTADLQRFIGLHAADPNAWDADTGRFVRAR